VGASSGHRSVSHKSPVKFISAASISRSASSKLLAMLCTNGFATFLRNSAYRRSEEGQTVRASVIYLRVSQTNGQVRSIDVLFDPARLDMRVPSWVRKASFTRQVSWFHFIFL
jgi:hypothetical protein